MTREDAIERLNNHTQYFVPVEDLDALEMAIDALQEQKDRTFEDTGLEPEEIVELCSMSERAKMADLLRLEDYQALGSIDHLRELTQAEKDGRLVVLPCKVGENIRGKNWIGEVVELSINSDGIFLYVRSGGGGFYCSPADLRGRGGAEKEGGGRQ